MSDEPMTLDRALLIADAVSHRQDGTSQAFRVLAEEVRRLTMMISAQVARDLLAGRV